MKPFRLWFVVPVLALLALLSAASIVRAQSSDERLKQESVKDDSVKDENSSNARVPLVSDWSHRYLVYSNTKKMATSDSPRAKALRNDRRFQQALARHNAMGRIATPPSAAELGARALLPVDSISKAGEMQRDWTSSLTTGGTVGDEQYPAKFSFNINAPPNCTSDFAVFNNDQASGTHGSGFLVDAEDIGFFYGIPTANSLISIDGIAFKAVSTTTDVNGVGTPSYYYGTSSTQAATNLVAAINAYATANPATFTYHASNTGFGFFGGGRGNASSVVTVTDTTGGAAGNTTTAAPANCFEFFGRFFGSGCPAPTPVANFSFFSGTFFGGRGGMVAAVANVIGFNQLYTGSPAGMCTGSGPNVMFAYGVSTEGGLTSVSPALSEDGTQLAIVESTPTCVGITGTCKIGSVLHLVKWSAGTNAAITGTVKVPNIASNANYRNNVGCANPCMTTLTISGTAPVSNSAPFVDYADDRIYVGDDAGVLHVFNGVFVGTPSAGWTSSIDAGFALTGPVFDSGSGNIYVADANGILSTVLATNGSVTYQVQTTGAQGPSEVGTTGYPIPDPPIVDGSAETVTVFVSNDNGSPAGADLDQFVICDAANAAALGSSCTVGGAAYATGSAPVVGPAGVQMHDGDFDNSYYNGSYADGYLYFCGKTPGPGPAPDYATGGTDIPTIQRAYFDSNGFLLNVDYVSTPLAVGGTIGAECSPMTEVDNGSDYMFFSVQAGGIGSSCTNLGATVGGNPSGGCLMSIIVNDDANPAATSPSAMPTVVSASLGEPGGTSGIIIDNVSAAGQASSVYFSPLAMPTSTANGNCASGIGCAVKATQAGLN